MLKAQRQKKAIAMTPLVDVIFLLLLFFMLSSTFSKFAEVELSTAPPQGEPATTPPIFLQLFPEEVSINGQARSLNALDIAPADGQILLVALQDGVTAQRLTDLLVALRAYPDLSVSVLGAS